MKRAVIAAFLALTVLVTLRADAVPTMAFGYLSNSSDDKNFDYLESLFTNSFANSLNKLFNVNVIRPGEVDTLLKKHDSSLQKKYQPFEVQDLLEKINADYFINGKFAPLPDNRIKITMSVFARGHNSIFTFTNTGRLETELFKLVDRIALVMTDFFGDENLYRTEVIQPGKKLAILTNIDGPDLNELYHAFLSKGYKLASMQGNYVKNYMDEAEIGHFKYIAAAENQYDIFSDTRTFVFKYGTWASDPYVEKVTYMRNMLKIYDFGYNSVRNELLGKLSARFGGIDNLLVIGFDSGVGSAWVRCINVREKDLVWMQSNITGKSSGDIANKIIERMSTKLQETQ